MSNVAECKYSRTFFLMLRFANRESSKIFGTQECEARQGWRKQALVSSESSWAVQQKKRIIEMQLICWFILIVIEFISWRRYNYDPCRGFLYRK